VLSWQCKSAHKKKKHCAGRVTPFPTLTKKNGATSPLACDLLLPDFSVSFFCVVKQKQEKWRRAGWNRSLHQLGKRSHLVPATVKLLCHAYDIVCLWYRVHMISCAYDIVCIWYRVLMISCAYDIVCLWYRVLMISCAYDIVCLWYRVHMISCAYDIVCLWYHVLMISCAYDIVCLWYRVLMISCAYDIVCLWYRVHMISCAEAVMPVFTIIPYTGKR